ncbi:MAG TPA: GNAT family protein [Planctomycetota bacterium]|nr:GNAT family protein [Planctomycetota bacterium]
METVETKRLTLRDFRIEDWKAVHEYAADPRAVSHLPWGPNSADQTIEFVRAAIEDAARPNRRRFEFAIILREEDRLVGGTGLRVSGTENRDAGMGYIIHPAFWKRGIASEAAAAMVEFGFRQRGLHRIWAEVDPSNDASARVLEKIGMIREGRLRQHKWYKEDWRDSYLYSILYPEWKLAREAAV